MGDLTIEDLNPCILTTGFLQSYEAACIQVGTSEIVNADILYYPNPTQDVLNLDHIPRDIKHIFLMNHIGQVYKSVEINNDSKISIDVSGFPTGVYLIKLVGDHDYQINSFIKQTK